MKLCMMSCMMTGSPPETVVRTAAECGMSAVDWVCGRAYAPPEELRKLSADYGLEIAAHTVTRTKFLTREADALDDFKRNLEFSVELGAPVLMLPPFPRAGQKSLEDDRKAWIDFYGEILPLVNAAGITLSIESTGMLNSPVVTASEMLEVLHAVPGLKCTLDYGNMETAGPALDAYAILHEYVVQFHLKDWTICDSPHPGASLKRCGRYFANALIGEGDLPLRAFWDTVDAAGRELYANLETADFMHESSHAAVLKRTSDLLRNW